MPSVRFGQRSMFAMLCAILLFGFWTETNFAEKVQPDRNDCDIWANFVREKEAHGTLFNWADFIPPLVPDSQNFALTPIVASSYSKVLGGKSAENAGDQLGMVPGEGEEYPSFGDWMNGKAINLRAWQQYYRTLALHTNEFPVPAVVGLPAADVLYALSIYTNRIENLRVASRLPFSRFPLKYDLGNPSETRLPHLASLNNCVSSLKLRACAELAMGQGESAMADVELMFRLMDSIRTEPCLISQMVRCSMQAKLLQPVWEGVVEHQWSDAQLVRISSNFEKLNFLGDYKRVMAAEHCMELLWIDRLCATTNFASFSNRLQTFGMSVDTNDFELFLQRDRGEWACGNKLLLARTWATQWQSMVDDAKQRIYGEQIQAINRIVDQRTNGEVAAYFLQVDCNSAARFGFSHTITQFALVAIALERYWLSNKNYPKTLAELIPDLMNADKLPREVMTGLPLHYERHSSVRYLLSAKGWKDTVSHRETGHFFLPMWTWP